MRRIYSVKTKILLFLLVLLIVATGFLRDFIFKAINVQLFNLYYKRPPVNVPDSIKILLDYNYSELYYSKWILTFAFAGLYLLLSCAVLLFIFQNRKYIKWCIGIYAIILILSFLFMAIGYLIKDYKNTYYLARQFMGFLQSPFILMMLIPAIKLYERQRINI